MWLMVGIFAIFGVICVYWCIQEKTKTYLSVGIISIVASILFTGLIYIDTNLQRNPKVIECIVTDKRTTGYLGSSCETTFLYNDREFTIENNALFQKVQKGDEVEMVVNFIRFNEGKCSIEYVTLVNQ